MHQEEHIQNNVRRHSRMSRKTPRKVSRRRGVEIPSHDICGDDLRTLFRPVIRKVIGRKSDTKRQSFMLTL